MVRCSPRTPGILVEAICPTIRPEFRFSTDLFLLFAHVHSTKIYVPLWFNLSFVYNHLTKTKVRNITQLFDQNIWPFFIYSLFCARPFDQDLGSWLIYLFHLHTTIWQNIWSSFIYSFFSARPFDEKLGFTFIYFFYLYTAIRPKIRVLIDLFYLYMTIRPKFRILINLFFL